VTKSLIITIMAYAVGLGLYTAALALTGRSRPPLVAVGAVVLEMALLVQAIIDLAALIGGDHESESAANVGYLLTSLAILPVIGSITRLDQGRWATAIVSFGFALLAVITLRLQQTLGASRA
jgi:hypothetical protein